MKILIAISVVLIIILIHGNDNKKDTPSKELNMIELAGFPNVGGGWGDSPPWDPSPPHGGQSPPPM